MEGVLKTTLDRLATIAKENSYIVQYFELFIASASFLSMLPCLFVIVKTGTLHWNCKMLLLCSAMVQQHIISMQLVVIIVEFYTGDRLPDDIGDGAWFMFVHEIGYGVSTVVSVYLVAERLFALWNVSDYSETTASPLAIFAMSFLAFAFAVPWAYYGDIKGHYYIGIAIILSLEFPMTLCSFVLYRHSKKMYKAMNVVPLSVRYQLSEILEYSRAVIPVVVFSSIFKSCSLIPCILWQMGLGHYGLMRVIYFSIHSLNCVIMKTVLIASHRGLRRTFTIYFSRNGFRSEHRIASRRETITEETEHYFRSYKLMWN